MCLVAIKVVRNLIPKYNLLGPTQWCLPVIVMTSSTVSVTNKSAERCNTSPRGIHCVRCHGYLIFKSLWCAFSRVVGFCFRLRLERVLGSLLHLAYIYFTNVSKIASLTSRYFVTSQANCTSTLLRHFQNRFIMLK